MRCTDEGRGNHGHLVVIEAESQGEKADTVVVGEGASAQPALNTAAVPPSSASGAYGSCRVSAILALLVVQNCSAVLLMRYTQMRQRTKLVEYSVSSVIISTELTRSLGCLMWELHATGWAEIRSTFFREAWKMGVPAGLYYLQNSLLFVALANLEATLFQVTYQMKLLITAVFMVLMLDKKLSALKWASLVLLFAGVVLTQLKGTNVTKESTPEQVLKGLVAVVVCSISSAFASVYFETVVKSGSNHSLCVRNMQLGAFSMLFAVPSFFVLENRRAVEFFSGYDGYVWWLVMNQAAGGMIVASVIKYADNILKGFATSIAIILGGVASYMWLDFTPSITFLGGAALVITAVGLYSLP